MAGPSTLRYHVPEGQDPASVLAALSGAGFTAHLDHVNGHDLLIEAADGGEVDRERVREAIPQAAQTLDDVDDPGGPGRPAPDDDRSHGGDPTTTSVRFGDE